MQPPSLHSGKNVKQAHTKVAVFSKHLTKSTLAFVCEQNVQDNRKLLYEV